MRTLCCCILSFPFVLLVSTRRRTFYLGSSLCYLGFHGCEIRARERSSRWRRRPFAAPRSQLSFGSVIFSKKRIAHGCIRNRERELNGHDATGFSRPYRDHFFRRLRYSISKVTTQRNGVFSLFYRPSGLISKLEDWPTRFV